MRNQKMKKLALSRETVRSLSDQDLGHVAGGKDKTTGPLPSAGGSDCPSVMICPTLLCTFTKVG